MNELNIAVIKHSREIFKVTKKIIAFVHNNKDYVDIKGETLINVDLFLQDAIESVLASTLNKKLRLKSNNEIKHNVAKGMIVDHLPSYGVDAMSAILSFIN